MNITKKAVRAVKKLMAAGMILLFLALYFVVGTGDSYDGQDTPGIRIEARR